MDDFNFTFPVLTISASTPMPRSRSKPWVSVGRLRRSWAHTRHRKVVSKGKKKADRKRRQKAQRRNRG